MTRRLLILEIAEPVGVGFGTVTNVREIRDVRCDRCAHWGAKAGSEKYGVCIRAAQGSRGMAVKDETIAVMTEPDFGCALWEGKP